jgi:hypothetical protein
MAADQRNIVDVIKEVDTDARFERKELPGYGWLLTAPSGSILAIGDDWQGGDWGFSYCIYPDAEALAMRDYIENDGGTTYEEARSVIGRWYAEEQA